MEDRVIGLQIKVKGTKEETALLEKLQGSVDSVRIQLARINRQEKDGVITLTQASKARADLNLQLKANRNSLTDLEGTILKNNDALKKNSGFVAGIKKGIQEAIPSFTQLATSFISLGALVSFGRESVKAFLEAEVNANKLSFAVRQIGKEGTVAFDKLIRQSEELQDKSIFSDDSIQQAQTALIQFGLTSDQVEKLIPQILDLASAQGIDLAQATDKVISAINGQTKGLKDAGIAFEDTGSKTENLALLQDKLAKFTGAAGDAMETTAGKAERLKNVFGDLAENVGEFLVSTIEGLAGALDLSEFSVLTSQAVGFTNSQAKALQELGFEADGSAKKMRESGQALLDYQSAIKSVSQRVKDGSASINVLKDSLLKQEVSTVTGSIKFNILKKAIEELTKVEEKGAKVRDDLTLKGQKERDDAIEKQQKAAAEALKASKRIPDELTPLTVKLNQELRKTPEILLTMQEVSEETGESIKDDFTEIEFLIARLADVFNDKNFQHFQNQALEISDNINQIQQNKTDERIKNIEKETDAQINAIDKQIEAQKKLGNNTDLLEKQKQKLIETTNKKIEEEQRKQFEKDKRLAKARAAILGIEAIIKTYSTYGYPLGVAFALAQAAVTATQIAEIESRTFAEGGIVPKEGGIIKGRSHKQGGVKFMAGGVLNEAQGGEPILVKEAGDNPVTRSVLSAINVAHGGRAFAEGGIVPAHKFQLGGITPSFTTRAAAVAGTNSNQMMSMINDLIDNKISNIKVTNVASETAATNTKISNIQSEVSIRG